MPWYVYLLIAFIAIACFWTFHIVRQNHKSWNCTSITDVDLTVKYDPLYEPEKALIQLLIIMELTHIAQKFQIYTWNQLYHLKREEMKALVPDRSDVNRTILRAKVRLIASSAIKGPKRDKYIKLLRE